MSKTTVAAENFAEDLLMVNAFLSGDKTAFTKIYHKYSNNVQFEFLKKTKNDKVLTQDLVMITFAKIHEKLHLYDSTAGAFSTWLYKMMNNIYIDHLRKDRGRDVTSIENLTSVDNEGELTEFQPACPEKNPEDIAIAKERKRLVQNAIDSLGSDTLKRVVTMRYIEEKAYEEIAEIVAIPHGTVKSMLYRAKDMLKKHVLENGL